LPLKGFFRTAGIAAGGDHFGVVDDRSPRLQVPADLARLREFGELPMAEELPAVSASGVKASTSAQASSAGTVVAGILEAFRPAGVGKTRRLVLPCHCAHWVWSM
jgi:hypothetical protein